MHTIEPFYNWRELYVASDDPQSPFYDREYNEFEFHTRIYNYYIHPQWDDMGSETLFLKIIFTDYERSYAIIELLGEWNDALHNDIMILKREIIDTMIGEGIRNFVLIGENVLNFHPSDDCYYEEWFDDIEDGWIVALNFRPHVIEEFNNTGIDNYLMFGGKFEEINWRTYKPDQLFQLLDLYMRRRIN